MTNKVDLELNRSNSFAAIPAGSSKPTIWSWLFGLLAILISILSAVWGASFGLSSLNNNFLELFSSALDKEDLKTAKALLQSETYIRNKISFTSSTRTRQIEEQRTLTALDIFSVLESFTIVPTDTLLAGNDRLERRMLSYFDTVAAFSSENAPPNTSEKERFESLNSLLKEYLDQRRARDILSSKKAMLETTTKELDLAYLELRNQLARLLGLPYLPPASAVLSGSSSMSIYQAGALSNLPVLDNLPDGIRNLQELAELLASIGGGVTISAPNPHEVFSARLEELRGSLKILISQNTDNRSKISEVEDRTKTLGNKLAQLSDRVKKAGYFCLTHFFAAE